MILFSLLVGVVGCWILVKEVYRDVEENEEEFVAPTDGNGIRDIKKNKQDTATGYPKKLAAMNNFAVASQVSLRVSSYIKKSNVLRWDD